MWRFALAALFVCVTTAAQANEGGAQRAEQIAAILGLQPLVHRIASLGPAASTEEKLEALQLRDEVLAELDGVSLTIDATLARLQGEAFKSTSARTAINDRYQRRVTTLHLA